MLLRGCKSADGNDAANAGSTRPLKELGTGWESCCMACDIKSLTREELAARLQEWGEPAYRADQALEWLYRHHATSWEAMTSLPKSLREKLREIGRASCRERV